MGRLRNPDSHISSAARYIVADALFLSFQISLGRMGSESQLGL